MSRGKHNKSNGGGAAVLDRPQRHMPVGKRARAALKRRKAEADKAVKKEERLKKKKYEGEGRGALFVGRR